jgi:hypothetical protein
MGSWLSDNVSEKYARMTFDVTPHLDRPDRCRGRFQYTHGSHRLAISKMELVADGKVVVVDEHRGGTAIFDENNEFVLEIGNPKRSKRYEIRACVQSEGGTDSNGKMYLIVEK